MRVISLPAPGLIMSSARIITLFSEPEPPRRLSVSFSVSIATHAALLGLFSLWLMIHVPQVNNKLSAKLTTVHVLNLDKPEPVPQRVPVHFATHHPAVHAMHASQKLSVPNAPATPAPLEIAKSAPAAPPPTQPMAQASLPASLPIEHKVVVENAATITPAAPPTEHITPPTPQPVVLADTKATIAVPHASAAPAEVKLSPAEFSTAMPQLPTRNLVVALSSTPQRPTDQQPQLPAADTAPAATPTPVTLNTTSAPTSSSTAISEIHLGDAGIASTPANITATAGGGGTLGGTGTDPTVGSGTSGTGGTATTGDATGTAAGLSSAPGTTGQDALNQAAQSTDRITLPKNGQYGVVVMGASLEDEFPEASSLWGGRMPYTVYVHVGLAKSWILQYSLPRAQSAAAIGTDAQITAPWPYDIMRPNLKPDDINADAVMVHGFVDKNGRFETLAVVSPQQFSQEKFVLDALRQWQFRPAVENGQNTDVEVLLIIPDELN